MAYFLESNYKINVQVSKLNIVIYNGSVMVKDWAFGNIKGIYLKKLEWTLPECCLPLQRVQ